MPTYRRIKGSNLTSDEIDDNFEELRTDLDDVIANPPTADSVVSVTQSGFDLTFHTTLGNELPVTVPIVQFAPRGEWSPFTLYHAVETVTVAGVGIFLVMEDHTSAATFDPLAVGGSPAVPLYNKLYGAVSDGAVYDQTTTAYTLVVSDQTGYIRVSDPTSATITIPTDAAVNFPVGSTVAIEQSGLGAVTVVGDSGVTVNCPTSHTPVTNGQFAVAQVKKTGIDEWTIFGNLVPA